MTRRAWMAPALLAVATVAGAAMGPAPARADVIPPVTVPPITVPPVTLPPAVEGVVGELVQTVSSLVPPTLPPVPPAIVPTAPSTTTAPVARQQQAAAAATTPVTLPAAPTVSPSVKRVTALPSSPSPATAIPAVATAGDYGRRAIRAARDLRVPIGISGLVLAFLAVHGRIDRRDPRLAFAPVNADEDLLTFS